MKLAYVITLPEHGGAQAHVRGLLAEARQRAEVNEVTLITSSVGWLTKEAEGLGVPVVIVPDLVQPLVPGRDLSAVRQLYKVLRRLRPDLVHLHSSKAGLLGRFAAKLAGVPAVFTAHGWAFADGVSPKRRLLAALSERLAAPLAARIIAVSEYDTALARRFGVGRPGQIVTIHNGIPDSPTVAYSPGHSGRCRVIMTARFAPQKDQATLIRAVARVPEVELTLIGGGEGLHVAQSLALNLGVRDRVHFLGTRSDVPELLSQADIFALISHYEGFPISILEGMRAGLPILGSEVGGVGEAVAPYINGFLVPRADESALVAALTTLAGDVPLRRAMGLASRERFTKEFTETAMLTEIWNLYLDILLRRTDSR